MIVEQKKSRKRSEERESLRCHLSAVDLDSKPDLDQVLLLLLLPVDGGWYMLGRNGSGLIFIGLLIWVSSTSTGFARSANSISSWIVTTSSSMLPSVW